MTAPEFTTENRGALRDARPLPDDVFIYDAVIHAYNLDPANARNKYGDQLGALITGIHCTWNPPEYTLPAEIFRGDAPIEMVVRTVFEESQTTMASHHVLRLDSWFYDGLCSIDKTLEALNRWPERVTAYVGVDPLSGPDVYLEDLKRQMEQIPTATGLKLYPHGVDPYRRWRADDPEIWDLFSLAQELGIRTIALHKAVPNGAVPMDPYRVDDIDQAADAFPDLNWEIVHSGMAFLDETAWAIGRFPNVFANLEITTSLLLHAPGWFEEILAQLMFWGKDKIIWSTGCMLAHPQPLLEQFWAMEFSDRTLEKFGIEQISEQEKRNILGLTYAKLTGTDVAKAITQTANDEFARSRSAHGLREPYSIWREAAGSQ